MYLPLHVSVWRFVTTNDICTKPYMTFTGYTNLTWHKYDVVRHGWHTFLKMSSFRLRSSEVVTIRLRRMVGGRSPCDEDIHSNTRWMYSASDTQCDIQYDIVQCKM